MKYCLLSKMLYLGFLRKIHHRFAIYTGMVQRSSAQNPHCGGRCVSTGKDKKALSSQTAEVLTNISVTDRKELIKQQSTVHDCIKNKIRSTIF